MSDESGSDERAESIRLSPDERERLARRPRGAGGLGEASSPPPPRSPKVRVHVHLVPSTSLEDALSVARVGHGADVFGEQLARIPEYVRNALIEVEDEVLNWIQADEDNAREFAVDPVGALRKAAPNLDPSIWVAVGDLQRSAIRLHPAFSDVEIASLRVDTESGQEVGTPGQREREEREAER